MNKPLRQLPTGSYQPIGERPLNFLPESVGISEAAERHVRALLSDIGNESISAEDEEAAAAALARLEARADITPEAWALEASQEYATLTG